LRHFVYLCLAQGSGHLKQLWLQVLIN